MLPCGAAIRQLGWGERVQSAESADGTWRARLAYSLRASGGTRRCRAALPSTSSAGESDRRVRTAHGALVARDRVAPAAALDAAYWRCTPPARLGRATAVCGRHVVCSSRAIATRRRRYPMLPCGAVIRQLSWECNCRARTARGELVSHDRDAPAAAPDAAVWRYPLPAHLGGCVQSLYGTWRARLTRLRCAGFCTQCIVRHCPPPARLGRVRGERRWRVPVA
jgi:hypothetical protein